jgi:asparagine synthase (glutamine-hydrolysing)
VDHRLIETVIGLRKTTDDSALPEKAWFKQALQGLVPPEVINRPKRGFTPPVREWHDALFREYGQALEDGYLVKAGVLRREAAKKLSLGPFPGTAVTPMSFKALVLEIWCRGMRERT